MLQGTFAADYGEVITFLTNCQNSRKTLRSVAALVFAHEASEVAIKHLFPYLEYWHYRSSDVVDIVFPGYVGDPSLGEFRVQLRHKADFSSEAFVETLDLFEQKITWQYSGQPTVIIVSAARNSLDEEVRFAFREVIDFDLASALKDEVIESAEVFFETLIRVCRQHKGDISQHLLSDILGGKSLGSALLDGCLENLPVKGLRKVIGVAHYFQLRNRQRKAEVPPSEPE